MSYTLTHRANHTVEISAHLESTAVDRERDGIVRKFRSKASVPGFRPGKAPVAAVRARFADEIRDELQEHLTGLLWGEVFDAESEIEPITNPQIRDLSFAEDGAFSFTAELEVRPRYDLPELGELNLPEVSLEISETEIDEELVKVQEEQAVWEPAEDDQAGDGMLAEVDLQGEVENSDDEPYTEDGASLIIGSDSVPSEINEALQGAKIGDERVATKTLPNDLEDKDKAGKTVTYTISVKGLKRKVLPEIDDDLATTIGLESLDELRQRVHDVNLTAMLTPWPCRVWNSTPKRLIGTRFPQRRNRQRARRFLTPSFSNSLPRRGRLRSPRQKLTPTLQRKPRATACRPPSKRRILPLRGNWSGSATRRGSLPRSTK